MDILFLVLSIVLILLGIAGSFLPVLPGPLTNWGGLLLLHYHSKVEQNPSFLWITFGIALAVFLLDYIIPALGTKKFGGTKSGVYGASIGLIVGLLFLGPFGVLSGPFFGAYVGELLHDNNQKKGIKICPWIINWFSWRCLYKVLSSDNLSLFFLRNYMETIALKKMKHSLL